MSGGGNNIDEEVEGNLNALVTRFQYRVLLDTLRREFQAGTLALEEKHDQLKEEVTNSIKDIQIDMNK